MSRWHLAVAGTLGVGVVVVVAWLLLLPYTMVGSTSPSFLAELVQKWNEGRVNAPVPSVPLAEARAQAARLPDQQVVTDLAQRFSLVVPQSWAVTSRVSGRVELASASTTLVFLYPVSVTEALDATSSSPTQLDGTPAIMATAVGRALVVALASGGYASLSASGPDAASLTAQMVPGVYLNQ